MVAVLKDISGLRPMQESDLQVIMEIEPQAYEHPWTQGIFHDCLRVGYSCWVLQGEDDIDAYGVMSIGAGEAHILNLTVRPEKQGMGYGKRLLCHFLDVAHNHSVDTVLLEVRPSNKRAIGLYHAMGFNEVGLRRDYYPAANGREDALILALDLA